jgi:hypothetical protein
MTAGRQRSSCRPIAARAALLVGVVLLASALPASAALSGPSCMPLNEEWGFMYRNLVYVPQISYELRPS